MTTSSILFGLGLALLAVYFVTRPLREGTNRSAAGQQINQRQQLLEQKANIYAAIKEIDSDVQIGKLEPADHQTLRKRYLSEGIAVLKALDELPADDPVDLAIEADLERWSQGQSVVEASGNYCPACGVMTKPGDRFCGKCGSPLEGG